MSGSRYTPPPGKGKAILSLVLGIVALVLPVPFLGLVCGAAGLFMAVSAGREGYVGGLKTAGFVLSIIGIISAMALTVVCSCRGCFLVVPVRC